MRVPGGDAGCVSGDQHVVVDDVEGKTAIYVQVRAFVFVESERRRQVRHHVPKIDDAVADVYTGVEEADEIGVADARFGPGVNNGREICRDVIEEIRRG